MPTIQADAVVNDVAADLNDPTFVFWPQTDLLSYLNDGQRVICQARPDASSELTAYQLAAGTKQAIPEGHEQFLGAWRNLGADGQTPGRAIVYVEREYLDQADPDWHLAAAAADVIHVTSDPRDPRHFFCYPPQPAADQHYIELLTAVPPANCTINGVDGATETTTLSISDIYAPTLKDYIRYRALMKETEARSPAKAQVAYQAFASALGIKVQTDRHFDAERNAPPRTMREAGR